MVVPEPVSGQKSHVSAWLDNSRTDIQKVFRCNSCGAPMFKYYDSLQAIVPGIVDSGENPIVIQCKGRYEFISILGRPVSAVCKVNYWIYR